MGRSATPTHARTSGTALLIALLDTTAAAALARKARPKPLVLPRRRRSGGHRPGASPSAGEPFSSATDDSRHARRP